MSIAITEVNEGVGGSFMSTCNRVTVIEGVNLEVITMEDVMRPIFETIKIEDDWTINAEYRPIIPGVELAIFDDKEAVLKFGGHDAVEFEWNDETERIFAEIDVVEPIELLEALYRYQIV